ncbi:MAG: 5-deoxy-glucuronate isomerase [Oscillospiraceae bacterium]|nr:5-deoxy-glucuronate isomerase [Oscillospiraceae bacterium]
MSMFEYPAFDDSGVKILSRAGDSDNDMMMDVDVYRLLPGDKRVFFDASQETAVMLVVGDVTYSWEDRAERARRGSFIKEAPWCLHVCKGVSVEITANAESEVLVQRTKNDRSFSPVFYKPEDVRENVLGVGVWEDRMLRTVRTVFDYVNAPYSNMVNGEVINHQGSWSSYTPHWHPQPEVYYYRFERPEGFGVCFQLKGESQNVPGDDVGEEIFRITDGSVAHIKPGRLHPQVTAPGFDMYYCWMIRHIDGNPWTDRVVDPRYEWLDENMYAGMNGAK